MISFNLIWLYHWLADMLSNDVKGFQESLKDSAQ